MLRRRALLAAPALLFAPAARAQQRPLRIITPFATGGATDALARIVGARITALTGQPVVVEARPGAGGDLAMQAGAAAEPDGHTLILGSDSSLVRNPMLRPAIPYDPERDFAPIARLVIGWYAIVVHESVPATTVAEFIAWARAHPGVANYGSAGPGTLAHVIGAMMCQVEGIDMQHIPFRGTGGLIPELLSGRVQVAVDNLPAYLPHVAAGRVRLLAVTSRERWFSVPQTPTVAESGFPGFEAVAWFGLQAPARTPRPIIDRVSAATIEAVNKPAVQAKLREIGSEPRPLGPAEFQAFINEESVKWHEVVRLSGARLD